MKIAFDIQPLLHSGKSGVGFHERGLTEKLMEEHPEDQFLLEYFSWKDREKKCKKAKELRGGRKNAEESECGWFPGTLYRAASLLVPILFPYRSFFRKPADITHFFNFFVPPGVRGKKIVTIHDMTFRVFPETVRWKTKLLLKLGLNRSIRRADQIVTVSEFSKNEILKYYPKSEGKIEVVPNGVDYEVFHPNYERKQMEAVKKKYGISGEYFLYLGTLEPRKNLKRLVEAYALFLKRNARRAGNDNDTGDPTAACDSPGLVLAGGTGWDCEELFGLVKRLGLTKNVYFPGYAEDFEVPLLMAGARIFCFPSLYEGFGMPPIEAMACGTPVLTSNTTALKEVAGDAAVTVSPTDTAGIAKSLDLLNRDEELRKQCVQRGLLRANQYSWSSAADKLYEIYKRQDDRTCSY